MKDKEQRTAEKRFYAISLDGRNIIGNAFSSFIFGGWKSLGGGANNQLLVINLASGHSGRLDNSPNGTRPGTLVVIA